MDSDKIDELKVSTVAGGVASLQKGADGWKLTEPTAAKADESEVNGITSNLSSLTVERVVDEAPGNLGDYGLKEPVIEVSFKSKGDKAFRTLQLGTKTPTGSDMYAKLANEKKVFLVQGYLESTFNRQPFDLRDKKILSIDRDKVDRLEVVNGDSTILLTKGAGDWKLASPVEARGDFGSIEGLVSRLQSAEMKSIVAENATDMKQYGLDKPAVLVTIGLGSARAQLGLGAKTDKGDVYARDLSRTMVVTVAPDLLTELQKGANDLRRKDIFEFRAYNLTRIELTRGATTLVAEKVKGKGKDARRHLAERCNEEGARRGEVRGVPHEARRVPRAVLRRSEGEDGARSAGAFREGHLRRRQEDGERPHWPRRQRRVCGTA